MAEDDFLLIRELKGKVAELMKQYELLESECSQLENENLELKERIVSLEEEKTGLGQKYENLKLAKIYEAGYNDTRVAKQRINKILREIDKCIALLNR